MKTTILIGVAAFALTAGGMAIAQAPVALPMPLGDGDHVMPAKATTRVEVSARVQQHFATLDANRDGFVTREEASAGKARMKAQHGAGMFDRIDTNKDGQISRAEFDAHHAQRGAKMGGMGKMGMGGAMFERADANRDNRVSLQEATDAALRHFDMADANRDGTISVEERQQMRTRMMHERKAPPAS